MKITPRPETVALLRLLRDLDADTLRTCYGIDVDNPDGSPLDQALAEWRATMPEHKLFEPRDNDELVSAQDVRIEVSRVLEEVRRENHGDGKVAALATRHAGARGAVFAGVADYLHALASDLQMAGFSRESTFSFAEPLPPPGQFWRRVIWGDGNSLLEKTADEVAELLEERDLEQGLLAAFHDRLRPVQHDDTPTRWLVWTGVDEVTAFFERGDGQWVSRKADATVLAVGDRLEALRALAYHLDELLDVQAEETGWFDESISGNRTLWWRAHRDVLALEKRDDDRWVATATDGSILKIGSRTECLAKLLEAHS